MDIKRQGAGRRRTIRLVAITAVLIAVLAGATFGISKLKPAAPSVERAVVWVDQVKRGPMLRQVRGLGTLVAEDVLWVPAAFDSRVLVIPQRAEVAKYFLWRQLDASANSLNMLASAHYTHAELVNKSTEEKHDLLFGKGINWAKQATDFKRGRVVKQRAGGGWEVDRAIPVFNRDRSYLAQLIPE